MSVGVGLGFQNPMPGPVSFCRSVCRCLLVFYQAPHYDDNGLTYEIVNKPPHFILSLKVALVMVPLPSNKTVTKTDTLAT